MNRACETCSYFDIDHKYLEQIIKDNGIGFCKHNAPSAIPKSTFDKWSVVSHDDWCGKYKSNLPPIV